MAALAAAARASPLAAPSRRARHSRDHIRARASPPTSPSVVDDADADAVVVADPFVVFENDDVLCVHKPAGASFHGDDLATRRPGVLARIRQLQASGTLRGSDYDGPLHSVHRLDKVTSGALLFAKVRSFYTNMFHPSREFQHLIAWVPFI
jgi:23S rRNA-/tRNA-specific pseudouridylate synthase